MKTKFKINNATQQAGNEKVFIISKMITRCNMQHSDWSLLLFEIGCDFVEKYMPFGSIQTALLTEKHLGFWDWFIMLFIEDDETLLTFNNVVSYNIYKEEKRRLLQLVEAADQFRYFLQSNKRLNEKF